ESLSLETTDLGTIAPRLVRLCHALDHLSGLHDDLTRAPAMASGWQPPDGFAAGARALAAWLEAAKALDIASDPALYAAIEAGAQQLDAERKTGRARLLEDMALQRMSSAAARLDIDVLTWANTTLYRAWRLAESLRV